MPITKDRIAAELVWRYVELVREPGPEGQRPTLTRAELEELIDLLEAAGCLPEALASASPDDLRATVRARIEALLRQASEARSAVPAREPLGVRLRRWLASWPSSRWAFRGTLAALVAALLALGTVDVWHRPAIVRPVPVPKDVVDVQPIDEEQAHRMLPRMVRNELSPREEKNLMGHMLVCPSCFEEYTLLRRHTVSGSSTVLRLVRR